MNVCDAGQRVEPAAKPFYRTRRVYVSKDGPRRTIRGEILSPIEFLGLDHNSKTGGIQRHSFIQNSRVNVSLSLLDSIDDRVDCDRDHRNTRVVSYQVQVI